MSRISSRLDTLEKKRSLLAVPKVRYVVGGPDPVSPETFEILASAQQSKLLAELAELASVYEMPKGIGDGNAPYVGNTPSLPPGVKPANFIFITEGGREYQINTVTKEKVAI